MDTQKAKEFIKKVIAEEDPVGLQEILDALVEEEFCPIENAIPIAITALAQLQQYGEICRDVGYGMEDPMDYVFALSEKLPF